VSSLVVSRARWRQRRGPVDSTGAAFALCVLCIAATTACDKLAKKRVEARVVVTDAPKHEKEDWLTLTGAKVLLDRGGAYERPCPWPRTTPRNAPGCIDHYFYVFPLVPEDWTPTEEIPAWVTCSEVKSLDACRAKVAGRTGDISGSVAVRVGDRERPGRSVSGWEKAIDQVVEAHQLKPAPRSPVLRSSDP